MHRNKRGLWKNSVAVAGMLLLLVLLAGVPVSVANASEEAPTLATPGTVTVQATPTVDATVTALNKEKLQHENDWLWNYGATILTSLISTLALAAAGIFTVVRYFNDRRDAREKQEQEAKRLADDRLAERERKDEEQQRWLKDQEAEREKQAEERFQSAVTGLGDGKEEARIGAAILLRTFLRPGYERFYMQTFDLAVAHLCLSRRAPSSKRLEAIQPLTILKQALITAFKESFPLARSQNASNSQALNATDIQLDNAYLVEADLGQAWMPQAFLRRANLSGANFREANLSKAEIMDTDLNGANLSMANLSEANLFLAKLSNAKLDRANLYHVDLTVANLTQADLRKVVNSAKHRRFFRRMVGNRRETWESILSLSTTQLRECIITRNFWKYRCIIDVDGL